MRKITKNFCDNNPVLLSYYRESRRYSSLDIRIRKTGSEVIKRVQYIPIYFQNLTLLPMQQWLEENMTTLFLNLLPNKKRASGHIQKLYYQI